MLKKILCTFLLIINILSLSGCWGYKEINDLPIVIGAAVDRLSDEEYLLTVEVLKTSEIVESSRKIDKVLLQTTGKTIFDALRKLIVKNGNFLYWANMKIMLISRDIAEQDIVSVLDLFYRDIEVRAETRVLIAKDKAADIFKKNESKDEPTSMHILNIMDNSKKLSKIYPLKMYEIIDVIAIEEKDFILPMLSVKDIDEKDKDINLQSAVFKKNRMIGTLNGEEVQTYILLSNNEEGGIRVNEISKDEDTKISYEVEKSTAKIKPIYENGEITINIDVITDVFIAEVMNYKFSIVEENVREYMKERLEEDIKYKSMEFLSKIQSELNSDILGFGGLIKIKYPRTWKEKREQWDEIFPKIHTNINVKVNFKGSALYSNIVE